MKSTIVKVLIGLFLVQISDGLNFEQELDVDTLVTDFMRRNNIPGVGVTIVQNLENLTFTRGYGYANMENNISANENTKFCIASITKTVTATLAMKVLSETFPELGAAVLETPIIKLHPNATFMFSDRFRYESMSFRDLLSHRVGVDTGFMGFRVGAYADIDEFTFRSRYAPEVASFRAGYFYSNSLYSLAGTLIAEIAHQTYETLLQDFFDELGMDESIIIDADTNYDLVENMSGGYFSYYGEISRSNSSMINLAFVGVPNGGIITTPNDIAKYISFHLNNGRVGDEQIVSEEALMWMRQAAFPLDSIEFKSAESGLVSGTYAVGSGFELNIFDGWQYLSHVGRWTTFLSEIRIYPELGFGTFSVSNGPIDLGLTPYTHSYLQNSIFAIVHGLSEGIKSESLLNQNIAKVSGHEVLLSHLAKKQSTFQNIKNESFVGSFGHPVEGEIQITFENERLYFRYGTWGTGYLNQHPTYPVYYITWTSDIVQDFYFAAGGMIDTFMEFEDEDTLNLMVDEVITFRRGVSLDTLPIIPWDPESCGPVVSAPEKEL